MNERPEAAPRPLPSRNLWPWLWTLLPAACGLALAQVLFAMASDNEIWLKGAWWLWYPFQPLYGDLAVTLQHLSEAQRGLDPLGDPTSEFAYPRAVLALRYLHLQDVPSAWLGTWQALVWMAAVIFVLRPRSAGRAVLTALIFFAPPVAFALQQSNIDLALFVVCVVVAVLWARPGNMQRLFWSATLTLLAALLKLYPAFVLIGGAWTDTAKRRLVWVTAMMVAGSYWLTHAEELRLVMSKFHLGYGFSWGCLVVFNRQDLSDLPRLWLIAGSLYTVGFLAAAGIGWRLAREFKSNGANLTEWAYYWIGSAICCGSFLATNYGYRWVFALLTLPLLLRVAQTSQFTAALWARITLTACAISLAAPPNAKHALFFVVQAANWAYVLLLVVGYVAMRSHYAVTNAVEAGDRRVDN